MTEEFAIPVQLARRLAVYKQGLTGPRGIPGPDLILDTIRSLGCLQIDPISVVAPTQALVLWSRLGIYDPAHLDDVAWTRRALFMYWAHAASFVLTEDYPIHQLRMRRWGRGDTTWERRTQDWIAENAGLRRHILSELRRRGPLRLRDFEDRTVVSWASTGWNAGRNVSRMLEFLWAVGKVTVAGRSGGQRLWALSEEWFPEWTPRTSLHATEAVRLAVLRSLGALGVATPKQINEHFTRGMYPGLKQALDRLVAREMIQPVTISDGDSNLPGNWFIRTRDIPLLEELRADGWRPVTTLLSPFDNLICDRVRTERLFGFSYRTEFYVPKPKRRYGYYVMPILQGEQLIGRADVAREPGSGRLVVKALYPEPDAPPDAGRDIGAAVESLATFVKAEGIAYPKPPQVWAQALV